MASWFTKSDGLVERQAREKLILVPLKTAPTRFDALYKLNETAGFVWREVGGHAASS